MIRQYWHNISPQVRILFLVYLCTLPLLQPWINSDGIAYYSQLRSMVIDHDLQFENEFRYFQSEFQTQNSSFLNKLKGVTRYVPGYDESGLFSPDEAKTNTGHIPNRTSFGPAVLWLPFFLIGHIIALLIDLIFHSNVANGYSLYYIFPVTFGTTVYGFLGLLLSYQIISLFASPKKALVSILLVWFASPLVYYMYLVPSMAHVLSFFTVTLFLYCWMQWRTNIKLPRVIILGILVGFMSLVRWQNVLFLLLPLGGILLGHSKYKFKYLSVLCIFFIFGFIPQMLVWKIVYGSFLLIPMGNETMNWFHPQIISVLFSSRHGLLTWTPIFIISIIGLVMLYKKEKQVSLYLLIIISLQVYINAVPTNWWCGSSFGYRRILDYLPIFILGLVVFLEYASTYLPIRVLYIIGILLVFWNIGLMIQFVFGMISHTEAVSFQEVLQNQFTLVPEKIGRIIQYLLMHH